MKDNLPKVTVVTVTYNAEQYLEQTIKSVIEQDYPNIEYIIIDGASSDGTIDIIKKYEKYISYWISEPDSGIYDAMNKGIDVASGEWINFMNAGDKFSGKNILKEMVKYTNKDLIVLTGYTNVINDSNETIVGTFPMKIEDILNDYRLNHQSTFTRTSTMKEFKFDLHYKYASDVDFFMKIGLTKNNYSILPFPVADFLQGGFWQQNSVKANIEILNITSNHLVNQEDIFENTSFLELHFGLYKKMSLENIVLNTLLNKFINKIELLKKEYKKVLLYGYGISGKICTEYLSDNLIGIVDKNINETKGLFLMPQMIKDIEYDCIVISVLGREKEIIEYLHNELNIDKNKIITFEI